jgi:prefoldin subunit 5
VYQDIIADLKAQIQEMRDKMEVMDKTIHSLQAENKKLSAMIKKNGI